jgi:hypothetical protein
MLCECETHKVCYEALGPDQSFFLLHDIHCIACFMFICFRFMVLYTFDTFLLLNMALKLN